MTKKTTFLLQSWASHPARTGSFQHTYACSSATKARNMPVSAWHGTRSSVNDLAGSECCFCRTRTVSACLGGARIPEHPRLARQHHRRPHPGSWRGSGATPAIRPPCEARTTQQWQPSCFGCSEPASNVHLPPVSHRNQQGMQTAAIRRHPGQGFRNFTRREVTQLHLFEASYVSISEEIRSLVVFATSSIWQRLAASLTHCFRPTWVAPFLFSACHRPPGCHRGDARKRSSSHGLEDRKGPQGEEDLDAGAEVPFQSSHDPS